MLLKDLRKLIEVSVTLNPGWKPPDSFPDRSMKSAVKEAFKVKLHLLQIDEEMSIEDVLEVMKNDQLEPVDVYHLSMLGKHPTVEGKRIFSLMNPYGFISSKDIDKMDEDRIITGVENNTIQTSTFSQLKKREIECSRSMPYAIDGELKFMENLNVFENEEDKTRKIFQPGDYLIVQPKEEFELPANMELSEIFILKNQMKEIEKLLLNSNVIPPEKVNEIFSPQKTQVAA